MEFHPLADLFPLMSEREFGHLCANIAENGLREAIWTHENKIVDGRNRYNACVKLGLEPRFREWDRIGSLVNFVVSLNLHRRHLSESQRAMVAAKLTTIDASGEPSQICETLSQPNAAKLLNVSPRLVFGAKKVLEKGVPELAEKVEAGEKGFTVSSAERIAELPKGKQKRLIRRGRKGAQKLRTKLMVQSLEKTEKIGSGCLLCDPKAVFTSATVSAFMQKLAYKSPAFARLFNDVVEELEGESLSETLLADQEKILAAIDLGYAEATDLQRASGLPKDEFDAAIAVMLDYSSIEAVKQGGKTDQARGAAKIIYRRVEKPEVLELEYEMVAEEF